MAKESLLMVFTTINKLFAEALEQLVVVYELSDAPRHFLENLKAPDYSLLILSGQLSLFCQFSVPFNCID